MNAPHRAPGFFTQSLADSDPEIFGSITDELGRQRDEIELIASENIVSAAVLEAQGSIMTNKYAEGYPGRRYYGGCQFVDVAENLAIERACKLFNCGFANVQPNSGSQANQGVFTALLQPGDTILGMSLDAGGHLTHGAKPNQSGKWFNAVQYGVRREDNLLDYDQVEALAKEHQPKLIRKRFALIVVKRLRKSINPSSLLPVAPQSRARSILLACARSPIWLAPTCMWTWRILQGWSRRASIPRPSLTRMWRRRPLTKPCAVRAAA